MRIWNAGLCNIEGCLRCRSLLWHGGDLVGHHAHCCCMCRQTNGKEHAYYCKEYGHVYLKDDGRSYSQVFVEDNGRDAAEAEWYGQAWSDRSWGSGSWSSSWKDSWSEAVPDQVAHYAGDAVPPVARSEEEGAAAAGHEGQGQSST